MYIINTYTWILFRLENHWKMIFVVFVFHRSLYLTLLTHPGKIVQLWDDGNPYRIQLENGEVVWAQEDTDNFIRVKRQRVE